MFPVSLSLLLLFLTATIIFIHQYHVEKQFVKQITCHEQDRFYLLQSLKKIENSLSEGDEVVKGTFYYEYGNVSYSIEEKEENLLFIHFQLIRDNGIEVNGASYFDTEQMRTVKWMEGIIYD